MVAHAFGLSVTVETVNSGPKNNFLKLRRIFSSTRNHVENFDDDDDVHVLCVVMLFHDRPG